MMIFAIIIFQVLINTAVQFMLKEGVNNVQFQSKSLACLFVSLITNMYIVGGVFLFVVSLLLWLYLLSKCELSYLYPLGSLSYALAALGGWYFFGESISLLRIIGIFIILIGVLCIAKS